MQRILIGIAVLLGNSVIFATPILPDTEYDLSNHPDGSVAPPAYGLRLDGLLTGNSNDEYTFDFENASSAMSMIWDKGADTLTISGTAYGGEDNGGSYEAGTTAIWDIEFIYSGLYSCGPGGLCADNGSGSLSSTLGMFSLVPVGVASHGYAFQLNTGHRGFAGISGWGWLNHCPAGDYEGSGASCESHVYSSDWLFTATQKVPEPGTLALFGLGLFGIGVARRQRRT